MTDYRALTAYDVPIPKTFVARKDVLAWVEGDGQRYGAVKVRQLTKVGWRTIWTLPVEVAA